VQKSIEKESAPGDIVIFSSLRCIVIYCACKAPVPITTALHNYKAVYKGQCQVVRYHDCC